MRIQSRCVVTSENAIILCCNICFPANTIVCYFTPKGQTLEELRDQYNAE